MLYPLLGAALAAYGGMTGALYLFQRRLLYHPGMTRPGLGDLALIGVREVTLTTADGLSLFSWYLPPSVGRPVIAYFHGNGGHIGYRTERLRRLAREGYGVLLVEYRGYAGNPGAPCEAGLYADGAAALDFIAAERIAPDRIVLWGESLGSGIAVELATRRRVAAVILEAPFTSIADAAQRHYRFIPAALLVRDRFELLVAHRPAQRAGADPARRARPDRAGRPRPHPLRSRGGAQGGLVRARRRAPESGAIRRARRRHRLHRPQALPLSAAEPVAAG